MKLYLRLLLTLLTSPFKKKINPLDKVITHWKVLPTDIDLLGHMNNGRYPMIMDLARIDFIIRIGMFKTLFKQRWVVPVGTTQLEFKKSLKPFSNYQIHTKLCYWDDNWFYFRQDFMLDEKQDLIAATGYVKTIFKGRTALSHPKKS